MAAAGLSVSHRFLQLNSRHPFWSRTPMTAFARAIQSLAVAFLLPALPSLGHTQAKRPLRVEDLYRVRAVRDAQLSPEGEWVLRCHAARFRAGPIEQRHLYVQLGWEPHDSADPHDGR